MSVQVIVSQKGPLPISVSFTPPGDIPCYLEVNGSVWTQTANSMIGIVVQLDGATLGQAKYLLKWGFDSPRRSAGIFQGATKIWGATQACPQRSPRQHRL